MNDTQNKNNLDKIKLFYDSVYYKNKAKPKHWFFSHYHNLAREIKISEKQHVLDIACGTGEWLFICSKNGAIPYGVDLSSKAISTCKTLMPKGIFHSTPAEELPFTDKKFDCISCLGALEHFVDAQKALAEMLRVAKDNAIFLFLVPNADFLTYRLKLYKGTNQAGIKEDIRTLAEWEKLFEKSGLKVTKKWRDLHVLSWSWISLGKWYLIPLRAVQAIALTLWPLKWQYQVYHLCQKRPL
ncbi:MAG: class I SAM-dependent methyltransferase [Candidatus Omnitrophota bacterium]